MAREGCFSLLPEEDREALLGMDERQALRYVQEELEALTQRQREVQLGALAGQRLLDYINTFQGKQQIAALKNILSTGSLHIPGRVSVEKTQMAVLGYYHAKASKFLEEYRPKKLGLERDSAGMDDIVREMYVPGSTKDPDAAKYAQLLGEVFEEMRVHFNRVGGDIPKLRGWNLPQRHDARKVNKVTFEQWFKDINEELDLPASWRAMDVGSEAEYEDFMRAAYQNIATDGLARMEPGKVPKRAVAKIAGKHRDHRYLFFKDGDAWLRYQKKYGAPDTFTSITDHFDIMSREIGAMEVLGPNPDNVYRLIADTVIKNTNNPTAASGADKIFQNVMGRTYAEHQQMADVIRGMRNLGTATKLTLAPLAAIADTAYQGLTASFNGIPIFRQYSRFLRGLGTGNKANREFAARMGFVAEYAIDRASTANRFSEFTGNGFMAKWADVTMRANGLSRWTYAGRQAFQIEFLGNITNNLDQSFDQLPRGLRKAYQRYGITETDWKALRNANIENFQGAKYIDPNSLEPDLQRKVVGMILEESDYAVPTANARVRATLNQGLKTGTVAGEMIRSVGQFKTFPVSVLMTHMGRAIGKQTEGDRLAYLAAMLVSTTVMGAVAMQSKELVRGRSPRPTDDGRFWAAALVQGGGFGLIGDFLFADVNRYGGGLATTLAGPLVGDFEEIIMKFVLGTAKDVLAAEQDLHERFSALTGRLIQKYSPGQLFYTKLLLDRYIFDQLNKQMDPDWRTKQRRAASRRMEDFGNKYWWKPGEFEP